MKPAPFDYVRPRTLAEACTILAQNEDALPIAGGQTLVPMLAMRLARPSILVDILRIEGLSGISRSDGFVVIGATTRQAEAEKSEIVAAGLPLLAKALPWVGHQPTRNRGTIGGSIANADPSAEIPLVATTLDAEIVCETEAGPKTIPASEFFLGAMSTALPAGACVKEVRFPAWTRGRLGVGFHEISARRSDFAYVSAAAQVSLGEGGQCLDAVLGIGGLGERPLRIDVSALIGARLPDGTATEIVQSAIQHAIAGIEAASDLHASANYRRRLAVVLALRALDAAVSDASEGVRDAR